MVDPDVAGRMAPHDGHRLGELDLGDDGAIEAHDDSRAHFIRA
jgi:hypothetical protein